MPSAAYLAPLGESSARREQNKKNEKLFLFCRAAAYLAPPGESSASESKGQNKICTMCLKNSSRARFVHMTPSSAPTTTGRGGANRCIILWARYWATYSPEPKPDVAVTMSEAKGGRVPMNGLDRLWPIKYTYMRNSSRVA